MTEKKNMFLKILKVELEDLHDDIVIMIEENKNAKGKEEISNYVFLENLSVLNNEILGIDIISSSIKNTDSEKFATLNELIADIESRIHKAMRENHIIKGLFRLIEKRIKRAHDYVL